MKSRKLQLAVLVVAVVLIGCQGPPVDQGKGPIVGVKIYETDRDLRELFAEWRELGINTVFVARDLVSKDEFHELAAQNDIGIFVIFPVFFAPGELAADPDLWAVTAAGERAKEDWVEFACPTRQEIRAQRVAKAVEIARMCQPAGLSIDFIRYFSFWEMVGPDRPADALTDSCFCAHCLGAFSEFLGVETTTIPSDAPSAASWIYDNAGEEWVDFKNRTITSMVGEIEDAVRDVDPEILINIHVVPWRSNDYDGAITRIVGQDRSALAGLADYLSPMCYSFMLHRDAEWIASVVQDVAAQSSCPVLPSIQVASAYREGEVFEPDEFEAALRASLEPPSAGVVFWSWDHIEADGQKADIIRQVVRGR